jgi:hypothetical protein
MDTMHVPVRITGVAPASKRRGTSQSLEVVGGISLWSVRRQWFRSWRFTYCLSDVVGSTVISESTPARAHCTANSISDWQRKKPSQ